MLLVKAFPKLKSENRFKFPLATEGRALGDSLVSGAMALSVRAQVDDPTTLLHSWTSNATAAMAGVGFGAYSRTRTAENSFIQFTISRRPSAEVPRYMALKVPFSCAMHNRGVEPVDMGAEAPPCSGHRQAWPREQWELPVVQIAQWKPGSIFSRLRLPMNLPMGFTRARL